MSNGMPYMKLSNICRPTQWPTIPQSEMTENGYPVYGANGRIGWYTEYNHEFPTVLITCRGATCGTINVCEPKSYVTGNAMALDELDPRKADLRFVAYALNSRGLRDAITGSAQPQITRTSLSTVEIPLPPLSEQKRIADILDKADGIRRKRLAVVREILALPLAIYRDRFGDLVSNTGAWKIVSLGECVTFVSGGTPSKKVGDYWSGKFPWVSPKDMKQDYVSDAEDHVSEKAFTHTTLKKLPPRSVLMVVRGMIMAHTVPLAMTEASVAINQDMKALLPDKRFDPEFLLWTLKSMHNVILSKVSTAAHGTKRLEVREIEALPIPLVPMAEQRNFINAVSIARRVNNHATNPATDRLFNSLVQRAFKGEL